MQPSASFLGSSLIAGERGADLEEAVFLVAVPVSPALDDLDGVVDALHDVGIGRIVAAGEDTVPVSLRALREQLQPGNPALPGLVDPVFPGLFRPGRLPVAPEPFEFRVDAQQGLLGSPRFLQMHRLVGLQVVAVA